MEGFDFEKVQATPEWLTSVLIKNGFLSEGEVSSIEQETTFSDRAFVSTFFLLKVEYSSQSASLKNSGQLPPKILMKMVKPEFYLEREIYFYDSISAAKTPLPLLTCYGTGKSPETKQGYMLLEDLTETHHQPQMPLPPVLDQCEEAIKTIAKVHAYWWNHPCFGEPDFKIPTEERLRSWYKYREKLYSQFVTFMGDRLSDKRKKTYDLVLRKLPELWWSRLSSPERLTLCHGDAHFWNYLYPYSKNKNQCVIFDWSSWRVGLGAQDLAYMIALWCYPEHRQRIEQPLLKLYLHELKRYGIDYGWENLQIDYRVYAIVNLFNPVHMQAAGMPPIWLTRLERAFAAFEDLNCMELL